LTAFITSSLDNRSSRFAPDLRGGAAKVAAPLATVLEEAAHELVAVEAHRAPVEHPMPATSCGRSSAIWRRARTRQAVNYLIGSIASDAEHPSAKAPQRYSIA
jgi:hypothetical protein